MSAALPADIVSAVRATMELEDDGWHWNFLVALNSLVRLPIAPLMVVLHQLGLDDATGAGEQASPVDLGSRLSSWRMDDLLGAMSDTQVGTVQAHIVNLGATDMVGALSAMGVFNMGDPTDNQTDPTLTNFMQSLMLLTKMRRHLC